MPGPGAGPAHGTAGSCSNCFIVVVIVAHRFSYYFVVTPAMGREPREALSPPPRLPVTAASCLAHSGGPGRARLGRSHLGMWAERAPEPPGRPSGRCLCDSPVSDAVAVGEQCSALSAGWGPGRAWAAALQLDLGRAGAGLGCRRCVSTWVSSEGPAGRPDVLGASGSDPRHRTWADAGVQGPEGRGGPRGFEAAAAGGWRRPRA